MKPVAFEAAIEIIQQVNKLSHLHTLARSSCCAAAEVEYFVKYDVEASISCQEDLLSANTGFSKFRAQRNKSNMYLETRFPGQRLTCVSNCSPKSGVRVLLPEENAPYLS